MGFASIAITAFIAFGSATNIIDAADVGLHANLILADTAITSSVCDGGFVDCRKGFAVIDGAITTQTCQAACDGSCCSDGNGRDACMNFSGSVCKDGSCSASEGGRSCENATIERVINSCLGPTACLEAGRNDGFVGDVVDSCHGSNACYNAGGDKGSIHMIKSSCLDGDQNCVAAGAMGGYIGIINNSCRRGNRNCVAAGGEGGIIGAINDSCQFGDRNCFDLAEEGSIGSIVRSCSGISNYQGNDACNAYGQGDDIDGMIGSRNHFIDCRNGIAFFNEVSTEQSCREACAASGGSCCVGDNACDDFTGVVRADGSCSGIDACRGANIGLVENSCVEENSCSYAGANGVDGDAGIVSLKNSCSGPSACLYAAYGGSVGTIEGSCSGFKSCVFAAYGGSIGTIEGSCRGIGACDCAAYDGGSIDTIEDSCNNGNYNCALVATGGGSVGLILSSCSGTADALATRACVEVGQGEGMRIDDINSCCNSGNEVCCQSSDFCDDLNPLPDDCAADRTIGTMGFVRRFADELGEGNGYE